MSRLQEKLEKQPDWRPWGTTPTNTVRCADGPSRRRSDCVLLPEVGWVRREDGLEPSKGDATSA